MLQRIIDVWPDLLGRRGADQSDSEEPSDRGDNDGAAGGSLRVDEAELLADFRNVYWTRLM